MKASGSIASLLQGVSQQVPQDRGPGQHTEQINMLPDPVEGLARRHGTALVAEFAMANDPNNYATMVADTANYRTFTYSNQQHDYVVFYRAAAIVAGSTMPVLVVYDRTSATWLPLARNTTDAQLDLLQSGGISAITAIGKYVFMAGYTTPSTQTTTNLWDVAPNKNNSVVWIRGGAYKRTYTVIATRTDGAQFTFSTTTPTSSYPGTLDTTGVPLYAADPAGGTVSDTEAAYITTTAGVTSATLGWAAWNPTGMTVKNGSTTMTNVSPAVPTTTSQYAWAAGASKVTFAAAMVGNLAVTMTYTHTKTITNPNYSKVVTDITNAFNTAVTNWIGSSADAIVPSAIAQALCTAAIAAGLTTATVQASTVIFDNVVALTVTDGGDGTLIRGVAQEVTSIDQVSDIHLVGKVVRVRASTSAESFYLKAVSNNTAISSGYTTVTWVEGAAVSYQINSGLVYLMVQGGVAYVASSATLMDTLVPGNATPPFVKSTVGDKDSSPLPYFIGKQITYLGVFQDRLMVGAGAVVRASKTGDYLNFFRSSVLTVPSDDPLEMLSQGSDDDTLRYSVIYGRDLVIFADKRQYIVSGRSALTPVAPNMAVMSSIANAAQLPPLAVGGVVFYGSLGDKGSSVFQIQPGQVADTPESFVASSQLDTYISGSVIELCDNAKPTHLLARTTGDRSSLVCFSYLDKSQQGRVQDAWHRLSFHADLGAIIGMSRTAQGVNVYFLRKATNHAGVQKVYLVCDFLSFTTALSDTPYFDSQRPLSVVTGNAGSVHTTTTGAWSVAFDSSSQWRFVGSTLADYASLLAEFPSATGPLAGIAQPTQFVPTNPFVRDKNDKAITSGDLTVGFITVSTAKSSGFIATVASKGREETATTEYNARTVGSPDDLVGRETVTDLIQSVPIALETRDYTLSLAARTWLPLTITTLEWVGQWFNRTQRF